MICMRTTCHCIGSFRSLEILYGSAPALCIGSRPLYVSHCHFIVTISNHLVEIYSALKYSKDHCYDERIWF